MSENPSKDVVESITGTLSEVAKAEQEQQKTAQSALDLVKQVGKGLAVLFSPAWHEVGLTLGDRARLWRLKNLLVVLERAQQYVDERGITDQKLKQLPFGDLLRATEAASQEEEESVQDLWSKLIANASNPESDISIKKVYVDILKSVSPADSALMELIFNVENNPTIFHNRDLANQYKESAEKTWRRYSVEEQEVATQNLIRMRCITFRPHPIDSYNLLAHLPAQKGSIQSRWAAVDPHKFERLINELISRIALLSGTTASGARGGYSLSRAPFGRSSNHKLNELNFTLTPLGRSLMRACYIEK